MRTLDCPLLLSFASTPLLAQHSRPPKELIERIYLVSSTNALQAPTFMTCQFLKRALINCSGSKSKSFQANLLLAMPGPKAPTPEQIAYMKSHAGDNIGPNIIVCATISATAATIFIALRLWSRRIHHGSLKLDASDYLALIAWFFYIPYNVVFGLITRYGAGRHIIFVTNPRLLQIFNIVDEVLYAVVLACLKFSILSLYRTIFGTNRHFYILTWVVTAVVACWALQIIISTNLQCIPISVTWDPDQHGKCINYGAEALAAFIIDIITDLTILSIPIPLVKRLNTSRTNRRGLMIVFAAGGSAFLVSLVQLGFITKLGSTSDPSWNNIPSAFLANTEILIGFLATSIATYKPLYTFVFGQRQSLAGKGYTGNKKGVFSDSFTPKNERMTIIFTGKRPRSSNTINNDTLTGIMVTDEIELFEGI
ncbi:hypothetical protein F4860DRAFT_499150 [Xylaria cubensis]|nr:hypothetical protein F4860DRAFT_499150 [Xylaria cubensis]